MPTEKWQTAFGASVPKDTDSFTITAPPKTDIWRPADDDDVFNAPMIYQRIKASDFKKIEATMWAPWKTQYDQGGLVIAFLNSSTPKTPADPNEEVAAFKNLKWIKAGIEFFGTESCLGIVGTDRYSDWSLSPMNKEYHQKAKFRAERDGTTLWIYAAQEGDEKLKPMREVKWAFLEGRGEGDILVGVYAAKPTPEEGNEKDGATQKGIEVTFSELVLVKDE
ncbi:uncharacterized protein RCC_01831 [Ramularia collo-cygni]|uniref:DUF1349 domain protein n=1 Tax=Ramularia collo-cygni TaxID=112498 RepID=A0A2D3UN19_9PEZI|nr:uncharacterized protein RCC_01831 [Ramularia collo-cygni]CZT15991.1 uncharacterized protein RCC_01831 [Ramularia collo-cygni]